MHSSLKTSLYLLRRELWENKSILWAPLSIAAVAVAFIILSLLVGMDGFYVQVESVITEAGEHLESDQSTRRIDFSRGEIVQDDGQDLGWSLWGSRLVGVFNTSMHAVAIGFQLLALIVAVSYLLGSLFNDRKNRSILLWKSLPFSEVHAVLVKLAVACLVVPLVALLASLVVQLVFGGSIIFTLVRSTEFGLATILDEVSLFAPFFIYLLVIFVFAIKHLPLYSWLLFSSALSKRSPILTALLPPLAIAALESLVLGTHYFSSFLGSLFTPVSVGEQESLRDYLPGLLEISPLQLLKIFAVSIPLLWAAIWLRDNRYEI